MSINLNDIISWLPYIAVVIFTITSIVTIRDLKIQHRKDRIKLKKEIEKAVHKLDNQHKAEHVA